MLERLRAWLQEWLLHDWVSPVAPHTHSPEEVPSVATQVEHYFQAKEAVSVSSLSFLDYEGLQICPECGLKQIRPAYPQRRKIRIHCEGCPALYEISLVEGHEETRLLAVEDR